MMLHFRPLLTFALLLCPSIAAAAGRPKLAVVDVVTTGIDPKYASTLTEVLTAEADALGRYDVISGADVKTTVGFNQERMILGCDNDACIAEIGGALGVDRILVSQVALLGDTYVLNVKLIDIKEVRTVARAYETVKGEMDKLLETIRTSVRRLFSRDDITVSQASGQAARPSTRSGAVVPASLEVSTTAPSPRAWLVPSILAGTGGVGIVLGVVFGLRASSQADNATAAEEPGSQLDIDRAKTSQLVANIGYGVGVAGIASGAVMWWLVHRTPSDDLQVWVAPAIRDDNVALAAGMRF